MKSLFYRFGWIAVLFSALCLTCTSAALAADKYTKLDRQIRVAKRDLGLPFEYITGVTWQNIYREKNTVFYHYVVTTKDMEWLDHNEVRNRGIRIARQTEGIYKNKMTLVFLYEIVGRPDMDIVIRPEDYL